MRELEKKLADLAGLVSIARKGGFVVIGQDDILGYDKKLHLILMDHSAGNSLSRQMAHISQKRDIPLEIVHGLDEIVKIENCKVIAIRNLGLSQQMIKKIKGE